MVEYDHQDDDQYDDDDSYFPRQSPNAAIVSAATQAFKWWLAVYFVLAHCFVVWKWDSHATATGAANVEHIAQQQQELQKLRPSTDELGEQFGAASTDLLEQTENYQQYQEILMKSLISQQSQLETWQKEMQELMTKYQSLDTVPTSVRDFDLSNVKALLEKASILENTEETFELATRELAALMEIPSTDSPEDGVLWADVAYVLGGYAVIDGNDEHNAFVPSREPHFWNDGCPAAQHEVSKMKRAFERDERKRVKLLARQATVPKKPIIPEDAVTKQELDEKYDIVRQTLDDRRDARDVASYLTPSAMEGLQVRWKEQVEKLNQRLSDELDAMEVRLAELQTDLIAAASENVPQVNPGDCLTEGQLEDIVYHGIDAIYQEADLRSVLHSHMMELVAKSDTLADTEIILDADLPMQIPSILTEEGSSAKKTVNLRQVLDTELLQRSKDWFDQVVEWAGGYNDSLDQVLDSIAPGNQRVGDVIVDGILKNAGKMTVPTAKSIVGSLPKKAAK